MFDKFYSHTHLGIVIEVSVVGFSQPLAFLCLGEPNVVYNNKLTYCEDPASVSCVLLVSNRNCLCVIRNAMFVTIFISDQCVFDSACEKIQPIKCW